MTVRLVLYFFTSDFDVFFFFFLTQWGLLITFIELIKNPRYAFWKKGFTRGAPEIEKVFESIARSCIGPTASALIQQQQQLA